MSGLHTNATDFGGRGSAAYDLGAFAPMERRRRTVPEIKVAKPAKVARDVGRLRAQAALALQVIFICTLVVSILAAMIASRAILTELNVQIATCQNALTENTAENTNLKTQLEAKFSMRTIEEYATQKLGMTPLDKSQISYVNLSGGDKIERHFQEEPQGLETSLATFLRQMKEYVLGK